MSAQHFLPASELEKMEKAKERSVLYEAVSKGVVEEGLTKEMSRMFLDAETELKQKAEETGSKPIGHAADVLKSQRLLMTEKDLADRFLRISNRMKDLRDRYPQ
eukprot:TRINITY_DN6693_c0_g1_i1.p1 TRINITY_DN6693_c0_g1~~TRINITY_DN6693_c0_g1_i1.p1  ORF type:complete len:104 (-),score=26.68 TRINITY_DN6693_c0_g1_i1:131-442(-)